MKFRFLSVFVFLFIGNSLVAQDGHKIEFTIEGFQSKQAYFAVHYDGNQYIKDTMDVSPSGTFTKQGDDKLPGGTYMVILPPDNSYFEVLVGSDKEQHFSMNTNISNAIGGMTIKNSKENELLYGYLHFLSGQRKKGEAIQKEAETATGAKKEKINKQLDAIDMEVKAYQENLMTKNKGTLVATIVKSSQEPDVPPAPKEATEQERNLHNYTYYKAQFWDNINFQDDRLIRTQLLQPRLERYLDKMTVQNPDSLTKEVDMLVAKAEGTEEMQKYLLIYAVNKYAQSKVVGMDAVYVHIVDNYYAKGKAPWTDEDQLKKMLKTSKELRPLLIGKKAPNIYISTMEGKKVQLYDIKSAYTVLYIWDPDCGHCKKAAPDMVKFVEDYKSKGVTMFSICAKDKNKEKCMASIEEKNLGGWLNTMATDNTELYYRLHYAIKSTPVTYILDKDKMIVSKRIGAKQLPEVMDLLIKIDAEKAAEKAKEGQK